MSTNSSKVSDDMGYLHFGWLDHSAFILMLALSTVVGLIVGLCGKQDTKVDYLHGGKTMGVVPIAMSLIFSQISGIALMGIPSDVYIYGSQFYIICISIIIACVISSYVFLPVFFDLQLTSIYEYLELRFSPQVRVLASVLFAITILLYIPIVIYVPALAFNQVSGVSIHLITTAVCIVCILYTMLGGLKAVVWTDFLQSFVTVGSSLTVIIIGLWQIGGPQVVWQRSYEGGRLEIFNMDPSPFVRSTFWTVTVGMTFAWLSSLAASQEMVQKLISLPDIKSARRSLAIFCVGNITMKTVTVGIGLIIFAAYHECDPLTAKKIKKIDQILPYYVMDTVANVPGLPGLFISGIFSASLSTLSSTMNCLSGTIYEDFILPFIRENNKLQSRAHIILKITVVVIGLVCIAMVFIVERLGGVFELTMSLSGITTGTFLGLFILGMVFPWANAKGALVGTTTSFLLMSWMSLGAQHAIASGSFSFLKLPLSVEGCDDFNGMQSYDHKHQAGSHRTAPDNSEVFILYRVSFMLYSVVGTLLVLIVGLLVSWVTGLTDPDLLDQRLIVPFMKKFVGKRLNDRIRPEEKVLL